MSARMLARLSRQRTVDRLPAALPAGAVIAHETGNLAWDSAEQDAIYLIREIALLAYQGLART